MSRVSFIESGYTTRVEYDKWLASGGGSAGGSVIVRGMGISHNVIPAVLLAKDLGCVCAAVSNPGPAALLPCCLLSCH